MKDIYTSSHLVDGVEIFQYYESVPRAGQWNRYVLCVGCFVRRYVDRDMRFLVSDRRPDALERALEWLVSEEDR